MAALVFPVMILWMCVLWNYVSLTRLTKEMHMAVDGSRRATDHLDNTCLIARQTMTCDDIPPIIPGNITEVIIRNHRGNLSPRDFKDHSWTQVETLYFSGYDFADIGAGQFARLTGVKDLTLNLTNARRFRKHSLVGLDQVRRLVMIDFAELDFWSLELAFMETNMLPKLEELTFNPGEHLNTPVIYGTDSFFSKLIDSPLKSLNFSKSIFTGKMNLLSIKLLLKLDVINVSDATIIPEHVGKLAITCELDNNFYSNTWLERQPLLQTLDVSGVRVPYGQQRTYNDIRSCLFCDQNLKRVNTLLFYIVNFHANNVQHVDFILKDTYDFRNTEVALKRLFVRNNNVVKIFGSFRLNDNNKLELLDASLNKVEYITPEFFKTATNLRYLYLSKNRMFEMQRNRNFSILFRPLKNLEKLDLSSNGLSYLPWNMFQGNIKLRRLSLASNLFDTVMFNLDTLATMEYLDLRNNAIRSLDGTYLTSLQSYVHKRQAGQWTDNLVIDLTSNTLTCSCSTLPFVKWLASLHDATQRVYVKAPTCLYEDQLIDINTGAVTKCKFLCHRTLIIALSVSSAVLLIAVIASSVMFIKHFCKRRHHVNKERMFKNNFLSGKLQQSHMVFLAHASEDEDIVRQVILQQLKRGLQKRLSGYSTTVCTGDDFYPGVSIIDEIHRFVKLSCVFVAVVSESFCRSPYCRAEVQEACNQNKPIILLFLGQVEEEHMTPYMREVFRRNSRVKLVTSAEGHFEFVPSLDTTCDSILCLAIDYRDR